MGTDIHLVVQRREGDLWVDALTDDWFYLDGRKQDYADFWEARDCSTFGLLRGSEFPTAIAERHGFPEGFSHTQRHGRDYSDRGEFHGETWMGHHSYGWATLAELIEAENDYRDDPDWEDSLVSRWISALKALGAPDSVRIVFGFDG